MCYQKLEDLDEVRHACDDALSLDPTSVKALYRRGQALLSLGEIENALSDFERVRSLEPENKAALNQIAICKQKIKNYENEEKQRYKNSKNWIIFFFSNCLSKTYFLVFSRFAAADGDVRNDN